MPELKQYEKSTYKISLNEAETLDFKNEVYQYIIDIINNSPLCTNLWIQCRHNKGIDFSNYPVLIDFLCEKERAIEVTFMDSSSSLDNLKKINLQFKNYYLHALKAKNINANWLELLKKADEVNPSVKLRRSKLYLLNKKLPAPQFKRQYHVQNQRSVVVTQEKQTNLQTQKVQQLAQQRQTQLQQQQQRMQVYASTVLPKCPLDLGVLIHRGNLSWFRNFSRHSMEEISTAWTNLTGQYAENVNDTHNAISHVAFTTFQLILKNQEQFNDSVFFANLPKGFGIKYTTDSTILFHDDKLLKNTASSTPLAPRLFPEAEMVIAGDVGQFFSFFRQDLNNYQAFCKKHEADFQCLYHPTKKTKHQQRRQALVNLAILDDKETAQQISKQYRDIIADFNETQLSGCAYLLLKKGSGHLLVFLNKLLLLKNVNRLQLFKEAFLSDETWPLQFNEWAIEEYETFSAMDCLYSMPIDEYAWWETMLTQHMRFAKKNNIADLVLAHQFFCQQVRQIDNTLKLPVPCPISNCKNLKKTYDIILYLLRKSLDPTEQIKYLDGLDWSAQGVICEASYAGPYYLITKKMQLTPSSGILNWQDFKHLQRLVQVDEREYQLIDNPDYLEPAKKLFSLQLPNVIYFDENVDYKIPTSLRSAIYVIPPEPAELLLPPKFKTLACNAVILNNAGQLEFHCLKADFDDEGNAWSKVSLQKLTKKPRGNFRALSAICYLDPIKYPFIRHIDQDKAYTCRNNKLDYAIDFPQLVQISDHVYSLIHAKTYFYRYIGAQVYRHNYEDYDLTIKALLHTTKKHKNLAWINEFTIKLLPVIAASTTNERSLREQQDFMPGFYALEKAAENKLETLLDLPYQDTFNLYEMPFSQFQKNNDIPDKSFILSSHSAESSSVGVMPTLYFLKNQKLILISFKFGMDVFVKRLKYYKPAEIDKDKSINTYRLDFLFISKYITYTSGFNPYAGIMSQINNALVGITVPPLLVEAASLLAIADHENVSKVLKALRLYKENIYPVYSVMSQRRELTSTDFDNFFTHLNQISAKLDSNNEEIILILAALLKKEEWHSLKAIIKCLQNDSTEKIPTSAFNEITELLKTVNVKASTLITYNEIDHFKQCLLKNNKFDRESISRLFHQSFPGLVLKDQKISSTITTQIIAISPMIGELDQFLGEAPKKKDEVICNMNNMGLTDLSEIIDQVFSMIIEHVKKISQLIREMNADQEDMNAIFSAINEFVQFLINPLKEIACYNLILLSCLNIITNLALNILVTYLYDVTHLEIAQSIKLLNINDSLLDKIDEKEIILSAKLKNFLLQFLTKINKNEHLAEDLNTFFLRQEDIRAFINSLKLWKNKNNRDEILVALYRQEHFSQKSENIVPSLTELTAFLLALKSSKKMDMHQLVSIYLTARKKGKKNDIIIEFLKKLLEADYQEPILIDIFNLGFQATATTKFRENLLFLHNQCSPEAFAYLCTHCDNLSSEQINILTKLQEYLTAHPNTAAAVNSLFCFYGEKPQEIFFLSIREILCNCSNPEHLNILKACCWDKKNETTDISVDDQNKLINQIKKLSANTLSRLLTIYQQRPNPAISSLQQWLEQDEAKIIAWLDQYELDPTGKRQQILHQYGMTGVKEFSKNIKNLMDGLPIGKNSRKQLKAAFNYVISCSNRFGLPIGKQIKPINQARRAELVEYFQHCRDAIRSNPDNLSAKLECLAMLCEVVFRTTGKYPYYSQIICVLLSLFFPGSSLFQIGTGQGKSITNALLAAMHWTFNANRHVSVCSRNMILVSRDYHEALDLFNYLDIPVSLVTAGTEENHYQTAKIIYSTIAEGDLYDARLKMVDRIGLPAIEDRVIICDEADGDIYDNKNTLNFSEGKDDPYNNPLKWLYPIANQYVDDPFFLNKTISDELDIVLLRAKIQRQEPAKYEEFKEVLTDFKLGQIIDAAANSQQFKEDEEFIVRHPLSRKIDNKEDIYAKANVLENHNEDPEAILSHGVHQCLHKRLDNKNENEIKLYQYSNGKEGMPPFSCDTEIECVDSQTPISFLQKFGKMIFTTGTAGTKKELESIQKELTIRHFFDIPARQKSSLKVLPTIFCDKKTSFFFGSTTQIDALKKQINQHKKQPILICCKNIEKADLFYSDLKKIYGQNVQVIHAKNAENADEFNQLITKAGQPGMITIVTPLAGRGVDIKPSGNDELSRTLLVIETDLDRYRNRQQIRGRTARDKNPGETMGIFDLTDLSEAYGADIRPLSYENRLKVIDEIVNKMDQEANLERSIRNKVYDILVEFENEFDKILKCNQHADEKTIDAIISAKAQFIIKAESKWEDILHDSDPDFAYPNPYIRYEKNELQANALDKQIAEYRQQMAAEFASLAKPFPKKQTVASKPPINEKAIDFIAKNRCKLPLENYIEFAQQKENQPVYYQNYLKELVNQFYREEIERWLCNNPNITDPKLKLQAQSLLELCSLTLKDIDPLVSQLSALNILVTPTNAAQMAELLAFSAVSFPAVKLNVDTQLLRIFLTNLLKQFNNHYFPEALITIPQATSNIRNWLFAVKAAIDRKMTVLAGDNKRLLSSFKHFILALEQRIPIMDLEQDFRKSMFTKALSKIREFVETTINSLSIGIDSRIAPLSQLNEKLKHPDFAPALLKKYPNYSIAKLIDHVDSMKIDGKTLKEILHHHENSLEKNYVAVYENIHKEIIKEFPLNALKVKLHKIVDDLCRRQTKGFFKNQEIYAKKITRFKEYVYKIEQLIDDSAFNAETEIKGLLLKAINDAAINTSTARFFATGKITLINDLKQLANEIAEFQTGYSST